MTSRDIFLRGKNSRSISLPYGINSEKFRRRLVRLLPVVTKLTALVGLIIIAVTFHAQLTRMQTGDLPSSDPASILSGKAEIVELRSAYANHYDLGDDRYLAFVGADPLNYQDAYGDWQPIQPDFTVVDGGWYVAHNTLRSGFTNDSTTFQIESGGYGFVWQPVALEINDDAGGAWQLAVPQPGSDVQSEALDSLLRYERAWSDPTLVEQFTSASDSLEQELVLANPPSAEGEGEWLSLRVDLSLPNSVRILVDGEVQTGEFTTQGALQLQAADGTTLLTLLPLQAYEENDPTATTGGRYRVVPQSSGLTLLVQTPLDWWLAPERDYPAVLDPAMQVLRPLKVATIGYPYYWLDPDAQVLNDYACVGFHDNNHGANVFVQDRWSDQGFVKFKLPNLPDGAVADQATLVAAPEISKTTFWGSPIGSYEDTLVYRVTQDWSFLEGLTTVPVTTIIAHEPTESDRAQIPYYSSSELDLKKRPVTQWDVTSDVQGWYADPSSNYGFVLVSEFDGHHLDLQTPPDLTDFYLNCFPKTSMGILDDVLANPSSPTARDAGIGLLIEYTSPQLAANDFRTVKVPSAITGPDMYEDQHHEYVPPTTSGWLLMAARGVRGVQAPKTSLKLTQEMPTDPDLDGLISDSGAVKEGETYIYFSEYVVANFHQSLPADLRLHVLEDTNATVMADDNRLYFLQTAEAAPSPVIEVETPTTIPMDLASGFIFGQELNLSASTTIEIKVPYGELPAEMFNLQLFPPSFKYGSRNLPGIQLTEGPDAWEIEMVVPNEQEGIWLLTAINDGEFSPPGPTLNAQVTACANTAEVIKYPVDGMCVELRTPPTPIPSDPAVLYQNGNVRIYSPLGFTDSCGDGTCTTVAQGGGGEMVMAMIGYVGDDENWVALKGGQFQIVNNVIQTTPNARLIMARFTQEPPITLPVLRGQFQANNATGVISSIGADPWLLVKMPLPDMDNGTWTYTIELMNDVMRAQGLMQRIIEPTHNPSPSPTTFNFNAQWSITARGGQDLAGETTLANSPGEFNVGTLIVDPAPVDAYSLEYDPAHISNIPQAIPEFLHIRLTNATLKQPTNLGGAQVPVQAVILNPGKSVIDEDESPVQLYCGTEVTCFDLRGEADTMTPSKNVDRGYRMPDLIIQDNAGTVMINTPQGVEIYSRDHPEASLRVDDYSFSYEAFGAKISTYYGVCPAPRDPLDPEHILTGNDQLTTVVKGTATLSAPNAESTSGGPQITVTFTLCENSMREMGFSFYTGDQTALPLGNSGLFMSLIEGRISLAPEQGPEPGYTTVTMSVGVRGMSPDSISSNVFVKGTVTIDTRGLFDMQLQAGLKVVGGYGVGVDGHFWVAWAPLDLGFEVQACAPYSEGFDIVSWVGNRCTGNELLFGSLRAHIWQGQGWQHKYDWLPDNDDMHIAARYKVNINIAKGMIVEAGFVVVPPTDIQLYQFTLAFGEFCTNQACTSYEWGVTGAYTILGYDFGIYYGFDSGLDFILGSGNYLLIDEAGGTSSARTMFDNTVIADRSPYTVAIPPGTPSAMFTVGWDPVAGMIDLSLQSPSGTVIDQYTGDPKVTVTITPTDRGEQTMIVVEDPEAGDWQIYTDGGTPLPPHQLLFVANKPEPTLQLADIPTIIYPGDVINLEWVSNISEHDTAWLSLYYTTTDAIMGEDQEITGPIVERLPLTPNGSYEWHVKGLAYVDNDYHIFARIDSEATSEINACGESYEYNPDPSSAEASCAMLNSNLVLPAANISDEMWKFWYEDEVAPASPVLKTAIAVDWTSIMVLWEPNTEVDIAGYLVRCTQTGEVRTARVSAEHMAGTNDYESARVNGLRPYQTATCSLRAYDTSGNISGDSASKVVVPEVVLSDVTISPENGATLTSVDEKITAVFPPGIVESDTDIQLVTRSLPPHPVSPLAFAGTAFNLSAYGPANIPVTQFLRDFTLEVSYRGSDFTSASADRLETLNLYWWDGETWQGLLPCEGCYHDTEGQRFVVVLDHLTEFAILAGEQPEDFLQYLPLIKK